MEPPERPTILEESKIIEREMEWSREVESLRWARISGLMSILALIIAIVALYVSLQP